MPSDAEEIRELKIELRRHAQLIDDLYRRLGASPHEAQGMLAAASAREQSGGPADVVDALRAGNVIAAIKLWREHYDVGLGEAKKQVEELQGRLGLR